MKQTPDAPELIKRKAAFDLGRKRYYTGRPCVNGHTMERYVSTGVCVGCTRQASKQFARVKNGATMRLTVLCHPEDAHLFRDLAAALQAGRDAAIAAQQGALNIEAERLRLFPDLASVPPGWTAPAFTPRTPPK